MPVDPNISLTLVQSVGSTITNLLGTVKILVGGVFGLYLIVLILRIRDYRLTKKTLQQINDRLAKIEKRMGLPIFKDESLLKKDLQDFKKHLRKENVALRKELIKR